MTISEDRLYLRIINLRMEDKEFEILMIKHDNNFHSLSKEDKSKYCHKLGIEIVYRDEIFDVKDLKDAQI